MMKEIIYPTPERIIEYNLLILNLIKVKKADKPEVLSKRRIEEVVEECRNTKGDIYDKAVVLLKGLIQKHPFASGNRRTSFSITERFLLDNGFKFEIDNAEKHAKTLQGIREGYYSDDEIKNWIKEGKIREFKR